MGTLPGRKGNGKRRRIHCHLFQTRYSSQVVVAKNDFMLYPATRSSNSDTVHSFSAIPAAWAGVILVVSYFRGAVSILLLSVISLDGATKRMHGSKDSNQWPKNPNRVNEFDKERPNRKF
jgi:hypothetical protein